MKAVSNSDFKVILRLLVALSDMKGETIREKENARKATLLYRKLQRKDDQPRIHKTIPFNRRVGVD